MCHRKHKKNNPAWTPCHQCENFLCSIHGGHAHDCSCPPLEVWDELGINPYFTGGELAPEALAKLVAQYDMNEAIEVTEAKAC